MQSEGLILFGGCKTLIMGIALRADRRFPKGGRMEMLRKSWEAPLSRAFLWLLLPAVFTDELARGIPRRRRVPTS